MMGEAYDRLMTEHRRLSILRALEDPQIGPECNDSILHDIVVREYCIKSSRDQIRTALTWLKDQGLIRLKILEGGVYIGGATQNGNDVARGNTVVPGVKFPSPEL
jgi:predicted transcriptional regulator